MSTSTIKPKRGTTTDWTSSGRILEDGEWGVAIVEDSSGDKTKRQYILKIGDGIHTFDELPAAVSTPDINEIMENMTEEYNEVMTFKTNITNATNSANTAAQAANTATAAANAAAEACQDIEQGMNAMSDPTLGKTYVLGVNNGIPYLEEQ